VPPNFLTGAIWGHFDNVFGGWGVAGKKGLGYGLLLGRKDLSIFISLDLCFFVGICH
jgi:hypothetical protein